MAHEESKEYLKNLIARQPDITSETNEHLPKLLQKSRVIRLFSRFQARYTHRWLSAVDDGEVYDLAVADWREELGGLNDKQIMIGLSNLPASWPPTSGEFRNLCLADEAKKVEYVGYEKRLEFEKPRNKKLAKKKIAEIKRILKGDTNANSD